MLGSLISEEEEQTLSMPDCSFSALEALSSILSEAKLTSSSPSLLKEVLECGMMLGVDLTGLEVADKKDTDNNTKEEDSKSLEKEETGNILIELTNIKQEKVADAIDSSIQETFRELSNIFSKTVSPSPSSVSVDRKVDLTDYSYTSPSPPSSTTDVKEAANEDTSDTRGQPSKRPLNAADEDGMKKKKDRFDEPPAKPNSDNILPAPVLTNVSSSITTINNPNSSQPFVMRFKSPHQPHLLSSPLSLPHHTFSPQPLQPQFQSPHQLPDQLFPHLSSPHNPNLDQGQHSVYLPSIYPQYQQQQQNIQYQQQQQNLSFPQLAPFSGDSRKVKRLGGTRWGPRPQTCFKCGNGGHNLDRCPRARREELNRIRGEVAISQAKLMRDIVIQAREIMD